LPQPVEILPKSRYQHPHENSERSKLAAGSLVAAILTLRVWNLEYVAAAGKPGGFFIESVRFPGK
jgi:hypothetical protein